MSEMIERVRQAANAFVVDADTRPGGKTIWCIHPRGKHAHAFRLATYAQGDRGLAETDCQRRNARAVIAAMRRPTEAMSVAGQFHQDGEAMADDVWEAMIDAALDA